MSPLCFATKIFKVDATGEVLTCRCVFDWRNLLSLEDEAGSKWEWPEPRTYVVTNHGEFYVLGRFEDWAAKMQQWEDFDTKQAGLAFSRN